MTHYDHDTPMKYHLGGMLWVHHRYAIELDNNGEAADARCVLWIAPGQEDEIAYVTTNGDPDIIAWRPIEGDDDMALAADAEEHWPWAVRALRDECLIAD